MTAAQWSIHLRELLPFCWYFLPWILIFVWGAMKRVADDLANTPAPRDRKVETEPGWVGRGDDPLAPAERRASERPRELDPDVVNRMNRVRVRILPRSK